MSNQNLRDRQESKSRWICALILLLALVLRFYRLELVSVTNDTAQEGLTALAAVSLDGWEWPLAGTPGEELRASAFFVSMIAVSNIVYWDPFSSAVVLSGFNLLAVYLVFRYCHRKHGLTAAWMAALLMATSPWSVCYSRFLIPASLLPVFSVCLLSWSLDWLESGGRLRLTAMTALAIAMPQLHFFGISAFVWLLLVLAKGYRRLSPIGLVGGIAFGGSVWIPWVVFQNHTGWQEVHGWATRLVKAPDAHLSAMVTSLDSIWKLITPSGFHYWFGSAMADRTDCFPLWLQALCTMSSILLLATLGFAGYLTFSRPGQRPQALMIAWIVIAAIVGTILPASASADNLQIILPIPFILIGIAASHLATRLPKNARVVPAGCVGLVAVTQILFLAGCVRLVSDRGHDLTGRYQLSYDQRRTVIREVIEDSGMQRARIVGSYSGWYPAAEYVYVYETTALRIPQGRPMDGICYWIDEIPLEEGDNPVRAQNRKEREINLALASSLRTSPDWSIERHWAVGRSQIYRMRFVIKAPLR